MFFYQLVVICCAIRGQLCLPKMLSGANAFEISNIQEAEKTATTQTIRM